MNINFFENNYKYEKNPKAIANAKFNLEKKNNNFLIF